MLNFIIQGIYFAFAAADVAASKATSSQQLTYKKNIRKKFFFL